MTIDKKNGNVCFSEKEHVYFKEDNPEEKYISVTTLIHSFTNEFNKDFWSAYKALELLIPKDAWQLEKKSLLNSKRFDKSILKLYNISENDFNKAQQNILDTWDKENRDACERGTKIHADLENSFYNAGDNVRLTKFGIGGKFVCKKDYLDLDLPYGVYPEYLIYKETKDNILRLAGQVDLIIKAGNEITIIDHKGLPLDTPILTSEGWSTMKDLKVGDKVFDKDGNLCNITVKSEVHHNPCYKINFDNSESIIADEEHRWLVYIDNQDYVKTTLELVTLIKNKNIIKVPRVKKLNSNSKSIILDSNVKKALEISNEYRVITNIEKTIMVPTQCIAVDSPSHTYLCGHSLLVTHNTNKKIDLKSGYNSSTKASVKMKYPLNNLDDCNYNTYTMQLSTYAWMLQQINPDFVIKDLILNHYDHKGVNTLYHCKYLKEEVERMLLYYKKQLIKEQQKCKRIPIEY